MLLCGELDRSRSTLRRAADLGATMPSTTSCSPRKLITPLPSGARDYEGRQPAEGLVGNCTNESRRSPTHVTNAIVRSTLVLNSSSETVIRLALSMYSGNRVAKSRSHFDGDHSSVPSTTMASGLLDASQDRKSTRLNSSH